MNRPAVQIKTPGLAAATPAADAAPTAEQVAAEEAALEAAVADTADLPPEPGAAAPAAAKLPTTPADMMAYIDAQIAKGVAAGVREIKRAQLKQSPTAAPIPDQSEVDPKKITDMVLSKQGYVIPHNYGKVPEHIRAQIQLGQTH
jgi:hypothetical protein